MINSMENDDAGAQFNKDVFGPDFSIQRFVEMAVHSFVVFSDRQLCRTFFRKRSINRSDPRIIRRNDFDGAFFFFFAHSIDPLLNNWDWGQRFRTSGFLGLGSYSNAAHQDSAKPIGPGACRPATSCAEPFALTAPTSASGSNLPLLLVDSFYRSEDCEGAVTAVPILVPRSVFTVHFQPFGAAVWTTLYWVPLCSIWKRLSLRRLEAR